MLQSICLAAAKELLPVCQCLRDAEILLFPKFLLGMGF